MDIDSIYRLYFRDVFLFLQGMTHNEALGAMSGVSAGAVSASSSGAVCFVRRQWE